MNWTHQRDIRTYCMRRFFSLILLVAVGESIASSGIAWASSTQWKAAFRKWSGWTVRNGFWLVGRDLYYRRSLTSPEPPFWATRYVATIPLAHITSTNAYGAFIVSSSRLPSTETNFICEVDFVAQRIVVSSSNDGPRQPVFHGAVIEMSSLHDAQLCAHDIASAAGVKVTAKVSPPDITR